MADAPAGRWQRLKFGLITGLAGAILRAWFGTCRSQVLSSEAYDKYIVQGRSAIGVTWHRGAIFFLYYTGFLKPAIMISRSKDGDLLARFTAGMGGVPVRGSSSRGGLAALREMAEYLQGGRPRYAATVADGPRGPRYEAKKGMIALAMKTGLPLLPIMWSANRQWVFKKSWDHTILPKPFARVYLKAGRELFYPPAMSPEELEVARRELEDELNRLKDELDSLTGYSEPA